MEAAWFSAIASSFSALTAFYLMTIHRRNMQESVRPDLVLGDWKIRYEGQGESGKVFISVGSVKNLGNGPANHVAMELILTSHFVGSKYKLKSEGDRKFSFSKITQLFPMKIVPSVVNPNLRGRTE